MVFAQKTGKKGLGKIFCFLRRAVLSPDESIKRTPVSLAKPLQRCRRQLRIVLARVNNNAPMRAGKARATGFDRRIRKGIGHGPALIGLGTAVLLIGIWQTASFLFIDRQFLFLRLVRAPAASTAKCSFRFPILTFLFVLAAGSLRLPRSHRNSKRKAAWNVFLRIFCKVLYCAIVSRDFTAALRREPPRSRPIHCQFL